MKKVDDKKAKVVWLDGTGLGHNLYGLFRKSFQVSGEIDAARINIFADTAYQLFVNGELAGFGPVRFDPRFPLYDSYDIAPFLHRGDNVVAVLVNHIGHKTFKAIPNRAGFIAWGTLQMDGRDSLCFDTCNGSWKCMSSKAHSIPSSKLSFALNDAEIFHQGMEETGWREVDFDDSHWESAVEVNAQNSWGKLEARNIPLMDGENINIKNNIRVFPLEERQERHSFGVPTPFAEQEENAGKYSGFIAFSTWIFSPEEQTVVMATWGGDIWVNGNLPQGRHLSPNKNMCSNLKWQLQKGWNFYCGYVNAFQGVTEHHVSWPVGRGLEISADKTHGSQYKFRHSPLLTAEQYERYLKDKPLPYGPEEELAAVGGWIYTGSEHWTQNPCMDSGWDDYGEEFEEIRPEQLDGHLFKISEYPRGFCLLIDLERMHLVYPALKMEGMQGAVIDLVYGERLNQDNRHIEVRSWILLGDRCICTGNFVHWLLAHPRGIRYMAVTVRGMSSDVMLKSLKLRSANYPAVDRGWFQCSDPCLNEIWQMGKRTLTANREDVYLDCSGRERGMYIRDTVIQYSIDLAVSGEHGLMERCLELYGQSPDATGKFRAVYPNTGDYTIADFCLDIMEGYVNYYNNTGDAGLIRKYWEAIVKNLAWFHELADEREDLLLDSEWHIHRGINSLYGGFHGDNGIKKELMDNTGIHCVFSCTYLIAMENTRQLALVIGQEDYAQALGRRIDILRNSIAEVFWDEDKGCFGDNHKLTTHSVHANIFALRARAVKDERISRVKEHIIRGLASVFVNGYDPGGGAVVSPAFAYYIFDGLYRTGLYDVAESMMKQGWGWMLAKGLKTCPEFFSLESSHCHAWSASPTYYLSRNVLGVNFPDVPNMDRVEIRVKASGITWAEGAFPHPRGLVEVKWHTGEDGKRTFDRIKAPEGVTVNICE